MRQGEPEAGPFTDGFGRKERFEYPPANLAGHTRAIVVDRDSQAARIDSGPDSNLSSRRGLDGIANQVRDGLLQTRGVQHHYDILTLDLPR
jgi:hypothetical protein